MSTNGFTSISDGGLPPNGRTHATMNASASAPVAPHNHGTDVGAGDQSVDALSYAFLRNAIGMIGIGLPVILAIGRFIFSGQAMRPSISAYYHGAMHDVFVGSLCAIGLFLLSYRDYRADTRADDIASTLGCLFVLGIALCPTPRTPHGMNPWIGRLHFTFATLFFITMAYFCLGLFTKTDNKHRMTPRKVLRNHVYMFCGIVIIGCIAVLALNACLPVDYPWVKWLQSYNPVFVFESIAIIAFGFSWLVKGGLLFADKVPTLASQQMSAAVTCRADDR